VKKELVHQSQYTVAYYFFGFFLALAFFFAMKLMWSQSI
jgi:hypothetical protein